VSIDLPTVVDTIEILVPTGIFLFSGYRALDIARNFVGGTYRGRAYWTAALAIAALILGFATSTSVPILSYAQGTPAFPVIFLALTFFADSNIRVMKESDFFHRDILRWASLRNPVLAVMVALNAITIIGLFILPETAFTGSSPLAGVFILIYFGFAGSAFTYFAGALIVGARRSADASLKRYARMLGLSLLSFMLFFTIWIPLSVYGNFVSGAVSGFFMIPAAYYIYLGVTSLSPLSKINRKDTAPAAGGPAPGLAGRTPSGQASNLGLQVGTFES
jgi:hypothetical protein